MTRPVTRFRFAAVLAALLPAFASAQGTPLVAAAAEPLGLTNGGAGTRFSNPVAGAKTTCGGTNRQLWLLNPTITVGEPVYMRLVVEAIDPTVKADFMAQLSYGADLQVAIAPPGGGRPYEFTGLKLGTTVPTAVVEMKDFSIFRIDFRIACDSESVSGAAFDIPGKYIIRFGLRCLDKAKAPETVLLGDYAVEVLPPSGEDAAAMALLQNPAVFKAFQARGARLGDKSLVTPDDVTQLRKLVETTPKSVLRPHAMAILADYEVSQKNTAGALKILRQMQAEYVNTPMADEAAFEELRLVMTGKNPAESFDLFSKIWAHPTRTQLVYPNSPLWKAYIEKRVPPPVGTQWVIQDEPGADPEMEGLTNSPRILVSPEVQRDWGLPAEMPAGSFQ